MKKLLLIGTFCLGATGWMYGQTFSDAVMMKKQEICFALLYDHGSWDHYWEGETRIVNGNVGTLTRQMVLPMVAYGINDKWNILLATPYVKTHSSGGQLAGVEGFQDIGLAIKYEAIKKDIGKHRISALGVAMFGTPMSNYLSDYMPYSLGLGTQEFSIRGIGQYEYNKMIYGRVSAAYLWRGQTEVERDFYYNNGSYYTTQMDVPNAINIQGIIGAWVLNHSLKLEASYQVFNCVSGDDIRRWNTPQPTNKAEFDQVGFFAQYFFQKYVKGLGIVASYSQMIEGRNMGEFTNVSGGLTYQFKF